METRVIVTHDLSKQHAINIALFALYERDNISNDMLVILLQEILRVSGISGLNSIENDYKDRPNYSKKLDQAIHLAKISFPSLFEDNCASLYMEQLISNGG